MGGHRRARSVRPGRVERQRRTASPGLRRSALERGGARTAGRGRLARAGAALGRFAAAAAKAARPDPHRVLERVKSQVPNPKSQNPNPKTQTEIQSNPIPSLGLGLWDLGFGLWDLSRL